MSTPEANRPEPSRSILRRALDGLYTFSGILAGFFLVAIFVIMLALSAGRPLGFDVPAADDFASWCMAATAFLGLAYTFRSGEFIRMGLITDRLPSGLRRVSELACLLIGCATTLYFAWYAVEMTIMSWRFNDLSQGVIAVPLWIPQIGFAGGSVILAIAMVDELVNLLLGGKPRYERPAASTDDEVIEHILQGGP